MTESEDQNLHAWYEFRMKDDSERVIGFQTQGTTPFILIVKKNQLSYKDTLHTNENVAPPENEIE